MNQKTKMGSRRILGFQLPDKLNNKIALYAKALNVSRSSVIRDALNEYFEQSGRIVDARTKVRQNYQIAWERLRMQSYPGKSNKELSVLFKNFIEEMHSELSMYGLADKDILEIEKHVRV